MSSPRFPPRLFLGAGAAGMRSGGDTGEEAPPATSLSELAKGGVVISPTSTLQSEAAASPPSPADTFRGGSTAAVPFARDRSRGHRRPWAEPRRPPAVVGLALAGALDGEGAPVLAATTTTVLLTGQRRPSPREMAASEGYTRVTARGGPDQRTTTHIFDGRVVVVRGAEDMMRCGLSPVPREDEAGFLRWCHLCGKELGQGKDIFMYRGEMAFCSHECRYREMLLHENL